MSECAEFEIQNPIFFRSESCSIIHEPFYRTAPTDESDRIIERYLRDIEVLMERSSRFIREGRNFRLFFPFL